MKKSSIKAKFIGCFSKENLKNNLPIINAVLLIITISLCVFILCEQKQIKYSLEHKTILETQKPNDEKQEEKLSISELFELNFDRETMLKAYNETDDYCENYPREGTGSLYICQEEYIQKYYPALFGAYNAITSFCTRNMTYAFHGKCCQKIIEAIKNNEQSIEVDEEEIIR